MNSQLDKRQLSDLKKQTSSNKKHNKQQYQSGISPQLQKMNEAKGRNYHESQGIFNSIMEGQNLGSAMEAVGRDKEQNKMSI